MLCFLNTEFLYGAVIWSHKIVVKNIQLHIRIQAFFIWGVEVASDEEEEEESEEEEDDEEDDDEGRR